MRETLYRCDVCNECIDPKVPEDCRNKHRDGFGITWSYKSPDGVDIPEKRMILLDVNSSQATSHICNRCIRAAAAAIKHFDES